MSGFIGCGHDSAFCGGDDCYSNAASITEVTASGAVTLPSMVFSGSATDSTLQITVSGAVSLPSLGFVGGATNITSFIGSGHDLAYCGGDGCYSGAADTTPEKVSNGAVTLPSLAFSGSATDSTSEVTASGAVTLPSLAFSGSATDSTSEVTASGAVTLPSLVFSGSATDSTPGIAASGAVTLPSLVFLGVASGPPQPGLNALTGAVPSQQAVDDQIQRGINQETLLTPAQVAVLLGGAYEAYSKEGVLPGGDLSVGGTRSILDSGFVTDNTPATVTRIAEAICNYWATNNTPGVPAHGGTAVQSVTIAGAAAIPAMEAAITAYITDQPGDGWVGFYNTTQIVVNSIQCTVVELMPPGNTPTPFLENIT